MDGIVRDLERHRRGEIDVGAKLFRIVQLEKWFELGRGEVVGFFRVAGG